MSLRCENDGKPQRLPRLSSLVSVAYLWRLELEVKGAVVIIGIRIAGDLKSTFDYFIARRTS